ncbi:ornithine cyclodeaminase [Castellaniella sp.]|uniref:ornithine cyclodeaminase n=1 Tax=Castellaniella sp. TaxID=1955812 RepID=UPI002AFF4681|nr:ornithine cyclodeaminase [Castellaniella sp.]
MRHSHLSNPKTLFLDTHDVARLLGVIGVPDALTQLVARLRADYLRWPQFEKAARVASYSSQGTIELMPISDGTQYTYKCVNGHPGNGLRGLPTVMAMGALLDCDTGMIRMISELTLTTAMRTAATSALAAQALARPDSRTMALIGNGAQSDFQALAFYTLLGIREIRLYDLDRSASQRLQHNLAASGLADLRVQICDSVRQAVQGADIVTTVTAFQGVAQVLSADLLEPGMHINAVGGDCPGKTELDPAILPHTTVFVEFPPQTRHEGEIQNQAADFPITELWRVLADQQPGRTDAAQITLFDSVGFALEDYSALQFLHAQATRHSIGRWVEVTPDQEDPRDLFGWLQAQNHPADALAG